MDEVTRDMVKAQLKSAKTPEALNGAMVSAMIAVVDCKCKTGYQAIIDKLDERLEGN